MTYETFELRIQLGRNHPYEANESSIPAVNLGWLADPLRRRYVATPSNAPQHPAPAIRVVGISGSLRPGSYTRLAVEAALRGAPSWARRSRSSICVTTR